MNGVKNYHRWLESYLKKCELGVLGYTYDTDEILDEMEVWFKDPRELLENILMAWDGTAQSIEGGRNE